MVVFAAIKKENIGWPVEIFAFMKIYIVKYKLQIKLNCMPHLYRTCWRMFRRRGRVLHHNVCTFYNFMTTILLFFPMDDDFHWYFHTEPTVFKDFRTALKCQLISSSWMQCNDECAWDDIDIFMLSKYCTTVMSPIETLTTSAFVCS